MARSDSEILHSETTEPAFRLLHAPGFEGPLEEFAKAHKHFRTGHSKEAIAQAENAFESTMKSIIAARRWKPPERQNASDLIRTLMENELIPTYLQDHFTSLRNTLEGGLPAVRNKSGGHGQGPVPTDVPDCLVAYALHLAATNIVFLIQTHLAKK